MLLVGDGVDVDVGSGGVASAGVASEGVASVGVAFVAVGVAPMNVASAGAALRLSRAGASTLRVGCG